MPCTRRAPRQGSDARPCDVQRRTSRHLRLQSRQTDGSAEQVSAPIMLDIAVAATLSAPESTWCLTLRQPWASLLVWGVKRIEGRNWSTRHRGGDSLRLGSPVSFEPVYFVSRKGNSIGADRPLAGVGSPAGPRPTLVAEFCSALAALHGGDLPDRDSMPAQVYSGYMRRANDLTLSTSR